MNINKVQFHQFKRHTRKIINTTYNLKKITKTRLEEASLKKYQNIITKARDTEKRMDKYLIDFYHIIGMAELTDKELLECCKLTKELTSNRPIVKWLAHQPLDRAYIAEKKKEQVYRLQSGITLKREEQKK